MKIIADFENWKKNYSSSNNVYPIIEFDQLNSMNDSDKTFFVRTKAEEKNLEILKNYSKAIFVLETEYSNKTQLSRNFRINLSKLDINNPVILHIEKNESDSEMFQLAISAEFGASLIDGFGDGIWITSNQSDSFINSTAFGILQATRTRISKTEYISCPSCGRTLFDLQETTQKIRERTSHLKGIKIGIMGCIVNGPGEMADADYGYVGTGPGKINLYKEKNVMQKNVSENEAVDALINLIKENGDWIEPTN